jgi:predicted LPLAT superfamily acyltransferase
MPSWKGQSRGTVLGYKIFVFTLKHLGLSFAYFILLFVASYYFLFSSKSSKEIYFYYRKIHKYSWIKSIFSIYRNYYSFGTVLLDKFAILGGLKGKFTYNFDGEHFLQQMANENTGGIIINAHIGSFETAGQLLERINTKIHLIMLDAEHQKIKNYVSDVLDNKRVNIIAIQDDFSHIVPLSNALINKELIAIAGDRFMNESKVFSIDFMGKKALFPSGPFYLAARFGVPVTFAFAMKETQTHYHFYATPPIWVQKYNDPIEQEKELQKFVELYAKEFERIIRKYPHQWFNYYSFWEKD